MSAGAAAHGAWWDGLSERQQRAIQFGIALLVTLIYPFLEAVEAGGLIAYAADLRDVVGRAMQMIARILKGARPAEIPFEQATRLSLAINQKTARALGITIPQVVLLRADRVIE